ncbi:MAG: hypothetical protein ACKO3T_23575, partial [Planctomycetaceae bacterium]
GSRLIQLDDDALGFGWHVGSGPVPTGAVDLGTVLRQELGHILGYGDLDPATAGDDIMAGTILPGERREAVVQTLTQSVAESFDSQLRANAQAQSRDALLTFSDQGQSSLPLTLLAARIQDSLDESTATCEHKSSASAERDSLETLATPLRRNNVPADHQSLLDDLFAEELNELLDGALRIPSIERLVR